MQNKINKTIACALLLVFGIGNVNLVSAQTRRNQRNETQRANQQPQTSNQRNQQPGQRRQQGEILVRNATIITGSRGTLANTDLLVRDGKIAQIGSNLRASSNAQTIDANGKYVFPGIVDAHSHAMIDSVNETTYSVTSMAQMRDVLDPTDVDLYRHLAGGVTALNILHGSANAIGGQNVTVKIKYGHPVQDFIIPDAPPGIKFALGENPKRSNFPALPGQTRRYPSTRMGVEETIREAFTKARDYQATWNEYNARVKRGDKNVIAPRRDLQLEPLVEIMEGKRWVHAHCYRADEILMILNLADDFGFKIKTLQHVLEGYKVAPEIARHGGLGGSLFADNWSYKMEAFDAIPYAAAIMTRAGVLTSINSDSNERARRLNIEAAKMMKYGGLSEEEAVKLITLNPAIQLGIDKRAGSIDTGKDADFSIWNGHPFSPYSRVEKTYVEGEMLFDRDRDLSERAARQAERRTLEAADVNKPQQGGASPAVPRPRRTMGYDLDDIDIERQLEADRKGNN